MPISLVRACLLSENLDPKYEIEPGVPVSLFVGNGTLINTMESLSFKFIPQLSPLSLYAWSFEGEELMRKALSYMLDREGALSETSTIGHAFELFHARWEVLQRIISPTHLPRYLAIVRQSLVSDLSTVDLWTTPAGQILKPVIEQREVRLRKLLEEQFHPFLAKLDINITDVKSLVRSTSQSHENYCQYVWMPERSNQPALDIILFFQSKTNNALYSILIDCKTYISYPKPLNRNELSVRTTFVSEFYSLFPELKGKIEEKNIFCGVVSLKPISRDVAHSLYHSYTSISNNVATTIISDLDFVAGATEMKLAYGPSLESLGWVFGVHPNEQ